MLNLLLGAVGAGTGLLSSLLGSSSKNSSIDDLLEELKKNKYSEDEISRRQNEVKRTYGNTVDSMIGASGFLNGDTARMIANSKIATQSAQAQIKERFALEDQNKQLDLKAAELSGQKVGTAGILSSALLDTLNTGIQGYTTGSYLDMLNPTQDVTETLTNDVINNTVANANQPIDMTNINRDLGTTFNGMDNQGLNPRGEFTREPFANWTDPRNNNQLPIYKPLNILPEAQFNPANPDYEPQQYRVSLPNSTPERPFWALDNVPTPKTTPNRMSQRQQLYNTQQTSNMNIGDELRGRPSNSSNNLDLSKMFLGNIMKMFDINQNQDFRNKKKQLPFAKSYFDMNFFGGR